MQNKYIKRAMALCDEFVQWQGKDGGINVEACPYLAEKYQPLFRFMEVPFMARALYRVYNITNVKKYKASADRYCLYYIDFVTGLYVDEGEKIAYKMGIALECIYLYANNNLSMYNKMIERAQPFIQCLEGLKTAAGCYFRCGYLPGTKGLENVPDVGFSDDLNHVGRGIARYHEMAGDLFTYKGILGLINYYLTDIEEGTMHGIWHPGLGTWAIGPWPDTAFEHMDNTPANAVGWVFSAYGVADFLLDAYEIIEDAGLKKKIANACIRSARWCFENCQFDDGALGMTGRDDKWLGLTATAVMYYIKLKDMELLSKKDDDDLKAGAVKAWDWLVCNTEPGNMPEAGYLKVTGNTKPVPGDNIAWLLAWTIEALTLGEKLQ